jgi:hypothetical protein
MKDGMEAYNRKSESGIMLQAGRNSREAGVPVSR